MPLTRTTLTAAIAAGDLTWPVASTATGFPAVGTVAANQPVVVDDELAFITGVPTTTSITVRGRGSDGTPAVGHGVGASVITSATPSDFPALVPGAVIQRPLTNPDITFYGADGAIAVPTQDTKAFLGKGTAAAMTLAAPSLGSNGVELVITSQTAAAHIITATALLNSGGAGSPLTTATFAAQIGAAVSLGAQNGQGNVVSANAVTFA